MYAIDEARCLKAMDLCAYTSGMNTEWHVNCMFSDKRNGVSIVRFLTNFHRQANFNAEGVIMTTILNVAIRVPLYQSSFFIDSLYDFLVSDSIVAE